MLILSGLVELKHRADSRGQQLLPVPWYHRGALGLMTGTDVRVGLERAENGRPVGDLVVSVLDLMKLDKIATVKISAAESPGAIRDNLPKSHSYNIALAEAATVASGARHELTMVLQLINPADPDVETISAAEGWEVMEHGPSLDLAWRTIASLQDGWVQLPADNDWREQIREHFPDGADKVDLNAAVICSDTERRLLRLVFPLKGARTVAIQHEDEPGALDAILGCLFEAKANILSALLRRGGMRSGLASLIAVCEPDGVEQASEFTQARLSALLRESGAAKQFATNIVRWDGPTEPQLNPVARKANRWIKPVEARKEFRGFIESAERKYSAKRRKIFLSRRFFDVDLCQQTNRLFERIKKVLADLGADPVEATVDIVQGRSPYNEVTSRLWIADGGIMVVTRPRNNGDVHASITPSMGHEFGYLDGQEKPLLVLLDAECVTDFNENYAVLRARGCGEFTHVTAFDAKSEKSIDRLIGHWFRENFPGDMNSDSTAGFAG
ncbi:MAG: hypothetical protein AAGD32_05515 [Planctomycetota bacterium]